MKPTVLIVDDEKNIRRTFEMVLRSAGFTARSVETGELALRELAARPADLVVLDVRLPGIDGLETLHKIREREPQQMVIMVSGHGSIATAVAATREGAFDFIEKPVSKERLTVAVRNAMQMRDLGRRVRELSDRDESRRVMVGESPAMQEVRAQITRAAPTNARILIAGESGTGKELVARAVHEASARRDGPFVKVNCAAIPEELIESELFGAVKGAYTGATASREGKFLQADGGTIFLDEVGDMSLKAQAKVLRALQEGEIERVGGTETIRVDLRVLAATNKDLPTEVAAGRFREDLYFRLNVVPIAVPPLRERREDIHLLAEHLLARYLDANGLAQRSFAPEAIQQLEQLTWPGNIRELGNAVERLAILGGSEVIGLEDLQRCGVGDDLPGRAAVAFSATSEDEPMPLTTAAVRRLGGLVAARQKFEQVCIATALDESGGNVSQAARLLGIDRTNLHKKIQRHELTDDRSSAKPEEPA